MFHFNIGGDSTLQPEIGMDLAKTTRHMQKNTNLSRACTLPRPRFFSKKYMYDKYRTLYYIIIYIYIYVYFYGGCKLVSFHSFPPQPHAALACLTVSHPRRVSSHTVVSPHHVWLALLLCPLLFRLSHYHLYILLTHIHSSPHSHPTPALYLYARNYCFSSHSHLPPHHPSYIYHTHHSAPLPTVLGLSSCRFLSSSSSPSRHQCIIIYTTGKHTGGGGGGDGGLWGL